MITQMILQTKLKYFADTGMFIWTEHNHQSHRGKPAGNRRKADGYIQIKIAGKLYLAHRLAWLYVFGVFPKHEIDHINRNKADNRIDNLREATRRENEYNKPRRKDNTSGYTGVTMCKSSGRWIANIKRNGQQIYLGRFDTPSAAHEVYLIHAKEIQGLFINLKEITE